MTATPPRLGLAYLIIGLAPVAFAVRGVTDIHVISPAAITHVEGASYIASIPSSPFAPVLVAASDDLDHPLRSLSRLFEDGRELGPAHAVHAGIAAVGRGRFSHWTTALYLSASDNSDPRTNGRVYRLETVARLPRIVPAAWTLTFLLAVVAARFRHFEEAIPSWLPRVRPIVLAALSIAAVAVIAIAGAEAARVALAGSLIVGFLGALHAGVMLSRSSIREFITAGRRVSPALTAVWDRVGSNASSLNQRVFEQPGWKSRIARIACLTVPTGAFIVTLTSAWPEGILAQAYSGGGRVVLAAAPALWLAHARRAWPAVLFGLTVTLVLFALPLAALWQDVTIHLNAIGGLLPFSDAQAYYLEANRLLDGHPLAWSARRPLFTAFLAVLLAVTGSLYVTLAVMVALNAIGTFLLAREIGLSFGSVAATTATLILFAFYRYDGGAGVVLSENLGFLLGTAALTALLRGSRLQDARSYRSGGVLLTAALMARAGAFLVLPALAAVALVCVRQVGMRTSYNIKSTLATICAIAIAATSVLAWGKGLSDRATGNATFSNYSMVLYGLVVGGKGWTQARIDHPNAQEGAEIYALAYAAFRARPKGLLEGLAKMARAYVVPSEPYHMFAFIQDGSRTRWLQLLCYALVIVGLGGCLWKWRDPVHALLLALAVGHFASIPLVPPIDAGLRVYAATMPVLALLVAAGVAVPAQLLVRGWRRHRATSTTSAHAAAIVTNRWAESAALILVVVIMGTSWTLYAFGKQTGFTRPSCPTGSESLLVHVDDDAMLRIRDDRSARAISPTVVRQSEAQLSVSRVELRAEASSLKAGMSLVFAYDLLDGRQVWLVGETGRLPTRGGQFQICSRYAADPMARRYGMMYVDDVRVAGTSSR